MTESVSPNFFVKNNPYGGTKPALKAGPKVADGPRAR